MLIMYVKSRCETEKVAKDTCEIINIEILIYTQGLPIPKIQNEKIGYNVTL